MEDKQTECHFHSCDLHERVRALEGVQDTILEKVQTFEKIFSQAKRFLEKILNS